MKPLLAIAAIALVLSACSAPAQTTADSGAPTLSEEQVNEAEFLKAAKEVVPAPGAEPLEASDEALLEMGYKVCAALTRGDMKEEETLVWLSQQVWVQDDGAFAAAWEAQVLCPDWYKG